MRLSSVLFSLLPFTSALVAHPLHSPVSKPLPLLIWHGLGDTFDSTGLHTVGDLANETHPGTHIHYVRLGDSGDDDRTATFFGRLPDQLSTVCSALSNDTKLLDRQTRKIRVDALGFSQGGQFLRGLIETCPMLSVRSLVTFGSQHNGISDVKACGTWDLLCKGALALMRGNVWASAVQGKVVPAQYYRTIDQETGLASQQYLDNSGWLADVNNEREEKQRLYAERLAKLEHFVMFVFEDDTTVVPKESGWFAEVNQTEEERHVIPLQERTLYKEDWIGLKRLDEKGALAFESTPGDHMQLDEGILKDTFKKYFGPEEKGIVDVLDGPAAWCGTDKANRWSPPWSSALWYRLHDWWYRGGGEWVVMAPLTSSQSVKDSL